MEELQVLHVAGIVLVLAAVAYGLKKRNDRKKAQKPGDQKSNK